MSKLRHCWDFDPPTGMGPCSVELVVPCKPLVMKLITEQYHGTLFLWKERGKFFVRRCLDEK